MHKYLEIYYFIDKLDFKELSETKKKINIIFRDYNRQIDKNEILKIKHICKKKGFCLYLANNIKLAIKLNLNGVYLPAFNKKLNLKNINCAKNFKIIGSAHNLKEIRAKEVQNVKKIFLSSIFKINKNFLGINKFKLLSKLTKKKVFALVEFSKKNKKLLPLLTHHDFAGISYFEQKKGP